MWWILFLPVVVAHYVCSFTSIHYYGTFPVALPKPNEWVQLSKTGACLAECAPCIQYYIPEPVQVGYRAHCQFTPGQEKIVHLRRLSLIPRLTETLLDQLPEENGVYRFAPHHPFIHEYIMCVSYREKDYIPQAPYIPLPPVVPFYKPATLSFPVVPTPPIVYIVPSQVATNQVPSQVPNQVPNQVASSQVPNQIAPTVFASAIKTNSINTNPLSQQTMQAVSKSFDATVTIQSTNQDQPQLSSPNGTIISITTANTYVILQSSLLYGIIICSGLILLLGMILMCYTKPKAGKTLNEYIPAEEDNPYSEEPSVVTLNYQ